jgi:hypothetical protein
MLPMQPNLYEKIVIVIFIISSLGVIIGAFLSTDTKNAKNKSRGKILLLISIAATAVVSIIQMILWSNTQLG